MIKIKTFLKKTSNLSWFLIFTIIVASFLRLYNLEDTLQFQGDQGRDSLIVADIFREKNPVFIGPVTSVGNMYLGPVYYYFMLPFLFLTYPSPMGPVYAVAGLGILTVFLLYKLGQNLVGKKAAIIATVFMTFSATVVLYTRFSWNPNPAPLASLLMIYFTYKAWKDSPKNWMWVSICFSVLIQLHYLTLLSLAGAGTIWLIQLIETIKSKTRNSTKLLKYTAISILIFVASLTPLMLFDLKHDGLNRKAFIGLLSGKDNFKQSTAEPLTDKIGKTLLETEGRAMHILFEINIGKNRPLNRFLVFLVAVSMLYILTQPFKKNKKFDKYHQGRIVVAIYLITGILGTALYEHTIFDHYIAYLFPVTFLIYGIVLEFLWRNLPGKLLVFSFLGFFLYYNVQNLPLESLGWKLSDIKYTSKIISDQVKPGEKYNIVLLSESGDSYGHNYRYFLSTAQFPPVKIGSQEELDSLYIINEEKTAEKPTDSPIYDIVIFHDKTPDDIFYIDNGPEIIVLRK